MRTVIKLTTGGVAIMSLAGGADEISAVENWKLANPGKYISHRQMADGTIPADRTNRHLWGDVTPEAVITIVPANLVTVKSDLSKQIDAAVLAIYDKPVALAREYTKRLKGATDYKAAGYAGVVPPRLAAFATAAGLTATAAADRVIAQAAQYEGAEDALSDLRMRKFEVQRATAEVDARATHTTVMGQIAVIAAGLV